MYPLHVWGEPDKPVSAAVTQMLCIVQLYKCVIFITDLAFSYWLLLIFKALTKM